MTDQSSSVTVGARRGQLIPGITLISSEGDPVRLSDFRGHSNLVILVAEPADESALRLCDEISVHQKDLDSQDARTVLVLRSSPAQALQMRQGRSWPFLVLADENGDGRIALGAGRSGAAMIITDRFAEIYAEYRESIGSGLPGVGEILDWLSFINSQCPECGVAEWPG